MTVVLGMRCAGGAVVCADSGWFSDGVAIRCAESKLWSMPRGEVGGSDAFGFSGCYDYLEGFRTAQINDPLPSAADELRRFALSKLTTDVDAYFVVATHDGKLAVPSRGGLPMEVEQFVAVGMHWKAAMGAAAYVFKNRGEIMRTVPQLQAMGLSVMNALLDQCTHLRGPMSARAAERGES